MRSGIVRLAKSAALVPGVLRPSRPGLIVLLYHRIGEGGRSIDLERDAFRRQLEFLTSETEVMTFRQGLAAASSDGVARDVVALTFDDGTADFHAHALPLLVEYRVPATLYVSTGPVNDGLPFPSWTAGAVSPPALSWSQVNEAVATGLVRIGSHTHTHADLDRVPAAVSEDELRRSRDLIEDHVGAPCTDFAYPHAVFSRHAETAVRRHYETAAVGGWRKNLAGSIDPYRITRVPITRADGDRFFRAKVRGRMAAEAVLYRFGGTRRA